MAYKPKKTNPSDPKTTTPSDSTSTSTPDIRKFFYDPKYTPPDSVMQHQIEEARKLWFERERKGISNPGTKELLKPLTEIGHGGTMGRYDNGGNIQQLD